MSREVRWAKFEVVHESDPITFRDKLNAINEELAQYKPKTTFNITPDLYQAIVEYEASETIPETALEEMEFQGLRFTCSNCPKFEPARKKDGSPNRAKKWGSCFLEDMAKCDSSVCEWFAKQFLRGEIKPIGGIK